MAKKTDSLMKKAKDKMFRRFEKIEKEIKDKKKKQPDNKPPKKREENER
ncbi:hypothetical protein ES703_11841 [subsurface metagenome]